MKPKITPLSSGYMLTSMVGFLLSVFYIYPRDITWGFTFGLFFVIMFVSSMISMTYAPVGFSHPPHNHGRKKKR